MNQRCYSHDCYLQPSASFLTNFAYQKLAGKDSVTILIETVTTMCLHRCCNSYNYKPPCPALL